MTDASESRLRPIGPAPRDDAPERPSRSREPLWRELVGEELRARRRELGQTLAETSRRAGVSPQYLSEMERGTKDASSEMIAAVSGALGLGLLDLTSAIGRSLEERSSVAVHTGVRSAFALAA